MALKRYIAKKDSTITNAFKSGMTLRATASNMGECDVAEIFSIYGQQDSASFEYSRALFEFPIDSIMSDRTDSIIPASGSVEFWIRLYNAKHAFSVPRKITIAIDPISQSWDEGHGLDLDNYTDVGVVNWDLASSSSSGYVSWSNPGGDYHTRSYNEGVFLPRYDYYMETGTEDISCDITSLVEEWIYGETNTVHALRNYGVGIRLTSSIETSPSSSYTKKFFTRGSEFYFKRPCIEARWDDSLKDRRGQFFISSSLATSADNSNTLYLYNYVRGQLKDIGGIPAGMPIFVNLYNVTGSSGNVLNSTPVTGGWTRTGIYSASVVLSTTSSTAYDVWYSASNNIITQYHTGTLIELKNLKASTFNSNAKYVFNILDAREVYYKDETPRFRIYAREKNWKPNIYTVAADEIETVPIEDLYYRVYRVKDELEVIEFGTGSSNHTRCSYDVSGSYFDFDMSILQSGYMYAFEFIYRKLSTPNRYEKVKEKFKFRVEE